MNNNQTKHYTTHNKCRANRHVSQKNIYVLSRRTFVSAAVVYHFIMNAIYVPLSRAQTSVLALRRIFMVNLTGDAHSPLLQSNEAPS